MPKKSTNGLREGCVATKKAVAEALGVSSHTVQHWSGYPIEPDGLYRVDAIREWWNAKTLKPVLTRKDRGLPSAGEIDRTIKSLALAKQQVCELHESSSAVAEIFRGARLDVLTASQAKMVSLVRQILASFDEKAVQDLKPADKTKLLYVLTWCFGVNFDKERLESNLSTENTAVIVQLIREMQAERQIEAGLPPKEN